jgi:hypothetical protein
MNRYKIEWTEVLHWQTIVEANSEKEALDKLTSDEAQEIAEAVKCSKQFDNIEIEEL